MKKLLLFCCLFFASISFSQEFVLDPSITTEFLPEAFDGPKDIILKTEVGKDEFYEIILKYDDEGKSFKMKPLTFPMFKVKLKQTIADLLKAKEIQLRVPEDSKVDNYIAKLFAQIVTFHNSEEERPEVATIYLKENIPFYYDGSKKKDTVEATLKDIRVEISFYGGFIEKMQVNGMIGNVPVTFNNKYSIGISSTKNIQQLSSYKLFSNEKFTFGSYDTISKNALKMAQEDEVRKAEKALQTSIDALIKNQRVWLAKSNEMIDLKRKLDSAFKKKDLNEYIEIDKQIKKTQQNDMVKGESESALIETIQQKSNLLTDAQNRFENTKKVYKDISEDVLLKTIKRILDIESDLEKNENIINSLSNSYMQPKDVVGYVKVNDSIETAKNENQMLVMNLNRVKNEIKSLTAYPVSKKYEPVQEKKDNPDDKGNKIWIKVSDVIRYVKKVDVNANDISPVPQLIVLDENQKESKLHREESSKLFEAVVYTDFLGIFDEANPNGIIQTEVNKQFNISSRRHDGLPKFIEGIGFLNYFTAQFQFSKIEKNNKFLLPSVYDGVDENGNSFSETYYTPLSLYQYRNFSIGGSLNLLFLENQNAKLNTTLDFGFLFGRSGIKDTEDQVDGEFLNNLEIPVELKFLILPEKRFSFAVSDRLSWFEVFDTNVNLKSVEDGKLVSKNRFLNTFNVGMNLDVSMSGKLFLRYKLIHELDDINTNFSQLQFGYSFYLLQKNGMKKRE